ncbi:hypothetical protein B0G84_8005 [Paraburkholderia sp. BL8N3]|jgi:hypothetical protein|nr:hypothetical protein B0G84_8005 [Paraburkholderia sp. BL8N3]
MFAIAAAYALESGIKVMAIVDPMPDLIAYYEKGWDSAG